MSDTVSDMLTCLRNAVRLRKQYVEFRSAAISVSIIAALKRAGFIWDYDVADRLGKSYVRVALKYGSNGDPVMRSVRRVSKPGNRVFVRADRIPAVQQGLGISLLSTNRGLLSNVEARAQQVGGELICNVY